MTPIKDSHCTFCGTPFPEAGAGWPRTCEVCGSTSYKNPLPVAVVLVPVDGGLLLVRRSIPPRSGSLALPGGFIGVGESWQEAGAREVFEETGLSLDPAEIRLFDTLSAPDGTLLVFGLCTRERAAAAVPPFVPNDEASETLVAHEPVPLAFPLHDQVAGRFWAERTLAAPP